MSSLRDKSKDIFAVLRSIDTYVYGFCFSCGRSLLREQRSRGKYCLNLRGFAYEKVRQCQV